MAVDLKKIVSEHKAVSITTIIGVLSIVGIIVGIVSDVIQAKNSAPNNEPIYSQTTVTQAEPDVDLPDNGGDLVDVPGIVTTAPTETITTTTTTTTAAPNQPVPLMEPYDGGASNNYSIEKSVSLGGIEYKNVPVLEDRDGTFVAYNLEGKYSTLDFEIGHIDGSENGFKSETTFSVCLDNEEVQTIDLNANDLPAHLTLDVTGCRQFKVVCVVDWVYDGCYAKYGIINGTLYP